MIAYSEWEYYIAKDKIKIFFPEGDYDINVLAEWYKVIPTNPEKISYYGDNIELVKRHFEKFSAYSNNVYTRITNDTHSNKYLDVWCMAIYNAQQELVGFSAQEHKEIGLGNRKIVYFNELKE